MEKKITEIVMQVLKRNNWGVYFRGQALQELPVSGEASMYRVNSVRDESIRDAISEELSSIVDNINSEGETEWHQKENKSLNET
tara:strand:+ start:567 stop:818 length:252 start_codon:yes stop_codon:yes gene_type:complete